MVERVGYLLELWARQRVSATSGLDGVWDAGAEND